MRGDNTQCHCWPRPGPSGGGWLEDWMDPHTARARPRADGARTRCTSPAPPAEPVRGPRSAAESASGRNVHPTSSYRHSSCRDCQRVLLLQLATNTLFRRHARSRAEEDAMRQALTTAPSGHQQRVLRSQTMAACCPAMRAARVARSGSTSGAVAPRPFSGSNTRAPPARLAAASTVVQAATNGVSTLPPLPSLDSECAAWSGKAGTGRGHSMLHARVPRAP